jgi:hypothetical protein
MTFYLPNTNHTFRTLNEAVRFVMTLPCYANHREIWCVDGGSAYCAWKQEVA